MVLRTILQIMGIMSTGIGSILAITYLWHGSIEDSRRKAEFWIRLENNSKKYKQSEKTKKDMEKIILSQIHFERNLVFTGVALIGIGMLLQIIGIAIS